MHEHIQGEGQRQRASGKGLAGQPHLHPDWAAAQEEMATFLPAHIRSTGRRPERQGERDSPTSVISIVLCSVPPLRESGVPCAFLLLLGGHPTLSFHPALSWPPSESTRHVTARDLGSLVMNQEPILYLSTRLNLVSGTNYPVENPVPQPPAAPRRMQAGLPAAFPTAPWTHKTGCKGMTQGPRAVPERLAQQCALSRL